MLRRRGGSSAPTSAPPSGGKAPPSPSPLPQPLHSLLALALVLATLAFRPTLELLSAQSNQVDFEAESSERVLADLCSLGPRPTGSAAADAARRRLLTELKAIGLIAAQAGAALEIDGISSSGAFYTDFVDGFTNVYQRASAVSARLSWPHSRRESVLVAAHYDSAPGSPGGSDNAINVAAALGALRALAAGPPLDVSVLILLNGAEEVNWVAAHAFATGGHKWAKEYRVVLNLEAIGAGGDSIIFQLGPDAPWLAEALAGSQVTPRGSVIAHELFQIPGFPAGTDLKTLLVHAPWAASDEDGELSFERPVGIDMAILGNGYVYHTPSDDTKHVASGQLRHLVARTTATMRAVAHALAMRLDATMPAASQSKASEAAVSPPASARRRGKAERMRSMLLATRRPAHDNPQRLDERAGDVFFDYCSWLWITYTRPTAKLLHAVAAITAVAAMLVSRVGTHQILRELFAIGASLLAVLALAIALWLWRPMATFGHHALALAVYGPVPVAVGIHLRGASLKPMSAAARQPTARTLGAASLAPWLICLWAMEFFGLGAAYLPALFCMLNGSSLLLAAAACHLGRAPTTALVIQTLGALLPILHLHTIGSWLLEVIIPISGRAGVLLPADVVIAFLIALVAVMPSGSLVAHLHVSGHARHLPRPLLLFSGVALLVAIYRPRFSPEAPKRLIIQHVGRTVNGEPLDSGLWVSAFDASGLRVPRDEWSALGLPAIASRTAHACDLDLPTTRCYLSFPFYFPLAPMIGMPDGNGAVYAREVLRADGTRISVGPPPIRPSARQLEFDVTLANRSRDGRVTRLQMSVRGPSHMALVLPEERLVGWSLAPGKPPPRRPLLDSGERVVFAMFTSELPVSESQSDLRYDEPRVWELWADVSGDAPLELAAYGHFFDVVRSPELDTLKQWMPEAARAGTWHWFASTLSRRTVALV